MRKKWQVICTFIGIFLAGAVVGSVAAVSLVREKAKQRTAPDQFSRQVMKRFVEALALTPEQTATLQPVVTRYTDEIKRVRREAFKETGALFDKMDSEVALQLTEEQKFKLKELQEKQRQKTREWMAKHGKRDGDRPPPGDAPPPPAVEKPAEPVPEKAP